MAHPAFFDDVPHLLMYDPLAQFLGASDDGLLEFTYLDAVKLAGHSCPTVASAYWMSCLALRALFGDEVPERGAVREQGHRRRRQRRFAAHRRQRRRWFQGAGQRPFCAPRSARLRHRYSA